MALALLLLTSLGLAAGPDDGGIGVRVGLSPDDAVPVGVHFGQTNDDFAVWAQWGRAGEDGERVRQWAFEVGRWGALHSMDLDDPDGSEEEQEVVAPRRLLAAPHLRLGGDTVAGERFGVDLDVDGLWNLASWSGLPPEELYAGLLFGAGMGVRYPMGGGAQDARGAALLNGGVAMGSMIARALHVRLLALARVEPLVIEDSRLDAAAMVGVSFHRFGAPIGILASGEARQPLVTDAPVDWRVGLVAMFLAVDGEDDL